MISADVISTDAVPDPKEGIEGNGVYAVFGSAHLVIRASKVMPLRFHGIRCFHRFVESVAQPSQKQAWSRVDRLVGIGP